MFNHDGEKRVNGLFFYGSCRWSFSDINLLNSFESDLKRDAFDESLLGGT